MFETASPLVQRCGRWAVATAALALLAACSALPQKPAPVARYDFGPQLRQASDAAVPANTLPLILANVRAAGVPDSSTAIHYRLAYADVRELRPYTQARWTMQFDQLIQQRVRDALSAQRAVVLGDDGAMQALNRGAVPAMLRLDVEEFDQVFESTTSSHGVLRLRATLTEVTPKGEVWLGQQVFTAQQPATSADAAGGAAALGAATDQVAQQLDAWLRKLGR